MAYVFSSNSADSNNAVVTELTVPMSAHASGDLVVVVINSHQDASQFQQKTGTTGWTRLYNTPTTGGDAIAIFYKFVSSSSEPNPTFQEASAISGYMDATLTVVRGAHATTTFPAYTVDRANRSYQFNLPTIDTTGYDDCLVLVTMSTSSATRSPAWLPNINYYTDALISNNAISSAWFYQPVGGVTPALPAMKNYNTTEDCGLTLIAIRDDGTGAIKGHSKPSQLPATLIQGFFWNQYSNSNVTSLITTLDGLATNYKALTNNDNNFNNISIYPTVISQTSNTTTPDLSASPLLNSSEDLTGSILSLSISPDRYDSSLAYADGGRYFGLVSGADAGANLWKFEAADSALRVKAGVFPFAFSMSTSPTDTFGTFDVSDVRKFVFGIHRKITTSTVIGYLYKLGTMILCYGNSSNPCSFLDGARQAQTGSLRTIQNQGGQSSGQFYVHQSIDIGDYGSTPTYWKSSNQSVELPAAFDIPSRFIHHQIGSGELTVTIKAGSGDTINLSSFTLNCGDYHNFTIGASCSSSATYNFDGFVCLNSNVTLQNISGLTYSGMTFSGCKELTTNGADLSGGNTISNCVDAQAITVTSQAEFQKLANCTFRNNTVAIKITGNQTGTWTDANLTVSGNTYDIEYTGTTNFSIQSASTLTVNNSSTGTLTIVTPTFDLVVNSSEAASQINVFSTGTQTIIDTAASASSLTYTHSGETVDITVLKDGYIPFRQTGVVLSGTVTIDVQLVKSREYLASHGLTYTTDASWDRSTNKLTVPTWGVTGQQVFSLIMEAFKSQTSLRNTAFNLQMDGATSLYLVNGAEGASDASITNMIECGVAYLDSSGTTTASWVGVKSVGTATGFTGEYQQDAGGVLSGTTDARATGIFNQLIKMYGDASHGNFDYTGHLVLKYQPNGYREVRSDVLEAYGISVLSPTLYIVAMQPVAIAAATGDPALTLTITDHGASPVTWNSKSWSITVVADATDSGENILRELNYNLSLDATYQGKDPFNWPEMVIEAGTAYETKRGITEGGTGAALKGVRVIDGSGNPHPDFTRMQADDGTYYVVPITANISISNLPDDVGGNTRLQIYNITTATLIYSGDPAGTSYSDSYTDGDLAYASAGDNIRIRFAHANAGTSFEYGQTIVQATSSGIVADGNNFIVAEPVYATNGIDGSTVTKFSYTPVNDQFNLIINSNFLAAEMFAFYCYTLTTADGIQGAYGAFVAQDAGNYKNITSITSIYLDNETTASKRQTDTARIYRDDGAYPVLEPTTSGFGIDINWQNVVYVVTAGSGLTAPQAAELTQAAQAATVNTKIGTPAVTVSDDIAAISAGGDATQAKQDTILANLAIVDSIVDAILVDTSTDIPASIAALTAPDNASITAIKAKTDQLTFTKANEIDANIQSVNDVTVNGTGATGNEWGP